ncbi:MAG: hypothetical protein K5639_03595 [Eubacterium sp.]|nr:hypothetical protein [Eubacterium sp.]
MKVTKRIVSAFLLLALCFMPFSVGVAEETAPAEETVPAEPTIPTEFTVSQTDAGYSEEIGYYVTIRMTGPSKTFEIKALVVDETGKTVEVDFPETVQADTDAGVTYYTIPDTGVGKVFTLRVYDDKKESCDVIVRSVSDIENVSLYKWIYNKNKAWVRYKKAGYAEGIQLKVEKSNGKKFVKYKNIKYDLDKKDFDSTKKLAKSITKIKGGQVQRITMRTYIIIDGVKNTADGLNRSTMRLQKKQRSQVMITRLCSKD